jgi:hypothetical protein
VNARQAYYSLIQYSEYPERAEYVNIGVVLFFEQSPRVLLKFVKSPRRAEAAFKVHLGAYYLDLVNSFSHRVQHEFHSGLDENGLNRFISMRAGKIRLSPPRSALLSEPQETLDKLFEQLVGDLPLQRRRPRVTQKLKHQLSDLGVEALLERPEPVELPQGVTLKAPYAYQNGRYNMISGLSLMDDPDQAIQTASAYAIKGEWLYNSTGIARPSRLIVVADVEGQHDAFVNDVSEMMDRHKVVFYRMNDVAPLAADIRRNVANR